MASARIRSAIAISSSRTLEPQHVGLEPHQVEHAYRVAPVQPARALAGVEDERAVHPLEREPVVVAVKFASPSGRVILSGKGGGREWNEVHSVAATGVDSGIGRLWARMKIEALTDEPSGETRQKIIDLGLEHHLVTQFTSLVAVDVTPVSSVSQRACETRAVPVNLPAGWGGIEGSLPRTATPAPLLLIAGALLMIVASWRLVCALR